MDASLNDETLKSNLESQLLELEMLESMFPDPGELKLEDPLAVESIRNYLDGKSSESPSYLDITVNVKIDESKFELCFSLSHEYPNSEADVYIRNAKINKTQSTNLNRDCSEFIKQLTPGEPSIYTIISWLLDNAGKYTVEENLAKIESPPQKDRDERLVRYWIYSHHIYSSSKRREIQRLAEKLKIRGFCMPGKPGIICVEGMASDCDQWWATVRALPWKRIFCKVSEECRSLRFSDFREVMFQPSGVRSNHCDIGELHKYLDEHSVGYIFKDLFGLEGKNSNT